jgi:hypothetical protein
VIFSHVFRNHPKPGLDGLINKMRKLEIGILLDLNGSVSGDFVSLIRRGQMGSSYIYKMNAAVSQIFNRLLNFLLTAQCLSMVDNIKLMFYCDWLTAILTSIYYFIWKTKLPNYFCCRTISITVLQQLRLFKPNACGQSSLTSQPPAFPPFHIHRGNLTYFLFKIGEVLDSSAVSLPHVRIQNLTKHFLNVGKSHQNNNSSQQNYCPLCFLSSHLE